jgi:hypothetical protein
MGPGPPGWGSLRWDSKILTVSSAGLRLKSDYSGKTQKQFNSKLQTRPLVREGATKYQSRSCLQEISCRKKNWSQVPDGRLTPGQTGRLTVGRKLTSTSVTYFLVTHFMLISFAGIKWRNSWRGANCKSSTDKANHDTWIHYVSWYFLMKVSRLRHQGQQNLVKATDYNFSR